MVKGLEKFNELVESFANLPTIGKNRHKACLSPLHK